MTDEELKLAAFEHLLSRIKKYEEVIQKQGYNNLISNKCRKKLEELKMLIKIEIDGLNAIVSNPKRDICYGEVVKLLQNDSEIIKGYRNRVNSLALQVFQESQNIDLESIFTLDVIPEWLFPTSTTNVKMDLDKVKSFREDQKDQLSNIDVDFLFTDVLMDNNRIQQTLQLWESQSKISKRLPILKEAIEAHIDGKFYLSVATLIPQVEGVLRDSLTSMGRNDDFNSMDYEHIYKAVTALIDLWKPQSSKTEQALMRLENGKNRLPEAVADLYREYTTAPAPMKGKLYRHGVCHGLQIDFGSKKNSTRLILLLDRIIFFYTLAQ